MDELDWFFSKPTAAWRVNQSKIVDAAFCCEVVRRDEVGIAIAARRPMMRRQS